MKKLLSIITVLALCLSMLPVTALAAESDTDIPYAVTGGNIYFDAATGTITGCDESVTAVEIPSAINGVAVTSIGNGAFDNCSSLTSVEIPGSVISIGKSAFSDCNDLTGIIIPDSVTSIGDSAFWSCDNLTSVTILGSVASIGPEVFSECRSLASVTILGNVTSIGDSAFYCCYSLKSIKIPDGVTSIEDNVFSGCSSLKSITIPDGVTSIGDSAFYYCRSLKSIKIPDGVTSIGVSAFSDCSSLTSVEIPDGVTNIRDGAFFGCSSLESIEIPDGVTSIGNSAFEGCSSLKSVEIPDGVDSIENRTFRGCSSLKSVEIPDGVDSIGWSAFSGCSSLESIAIPVGVTSIENGTFSGCSGLTSITIPVSVTSIGGSAFEGCSGLTSVTIPDSVTGIGGSAFEGCSGLTSVTIPDSVTGIGWSAFSGCSSLENITIPDSVTSIEDNVFSGCSSLTAISVGPGNTRYASEDGVLFDKQESILIYYPEGKRDASYAIPDGVTSIENGAFSGCSGLTSITIPDSVTSIGWSAFSDCSGLTSITIPVSVTSIGGSAFEGCSGLTSITIPDRVTSIEDSTFSGCSGLTSITIPVSVTSIGGSAFEGCTGLTSITIPDSVTSIGGSAFEGCTGLTSITIPDSVDNIASHAFSGCSSLTSVTIPDSVTSIGWSAFSDCSGLKSIRIPGRVTSIENQTFSDCSSLTSVTIPDSVTSIGWWAFDGCDSLTDVHYAGSEDEWKKITIEGRNDPLTSATIHYNSTGPKTYTLTVIDGTGSGEYAEGDQVTISAYADAEGKVFDKWTTNGGGSFTDAAKTSTTFTMPAKDVEVTATYKAATPPAQTFTVIVEYGTGSGDYEIGKDVRITANPAPEGEVFDKWVTNDGVNFENATSATTTFTMPAHKVTVTATYKPRTFTLTVEYGTGGGDYEIGKDVKITAYAAPKGKEFDKWITSNGGTFADETSATTTFTMPASDVTVTATYKDIAAPPAPAQTYTVTVNGGTGGGKYAAGAKVTITAYGAPEGKVFDKWTTSSGVIFADATRGSTTFTMPASDVTVTATYKDATTAPEQTYTLTVTGGTGGGKYAAGAKAAIKANAAPDGKVFDKWTTSRGGTFADAASASTTFTMPANDVTVTATYKDIATPPASEQTYTLTVTGGTGGGKYAAGAKAAITADAAPEGKVFDKWTTSNGGTFEDETSATTTFTMPANDVTVTATYRDATPPERTAYMISFDPNGGTVDIPSMVTGTDGRLSVLPIPFYSGYIFNGWYTAPTGGSLISRDTVFDGNTTVYAHWVLEHDVSDSSSSPLTEYAIIAPSTTGGTVAVNREYAARGTSISITVTPDSGYEMTSLIARDSWWNELKLTARGGGRYTFTMPDRAVTVNATFTVTATERQPEPVVRPVRVWPYPGFTDVPASAWYYDAVRFVCETGLMNGLSSTTFSPYDNLSRAQLTQILYNMAGSPAAGSVSGFADVVPSNWYANAVAWAVSRNIVDGYDGGTFGPYDSVTREEIVVMLWRYAGEPASEEELYFSDTANISTYTQTAVRWAVEKGILSGNSDGALTPKGLATRAQVAQMLKNYFNA